MKRALQIPWKTVRHRVGRRTEAVVYIVARVYEALRPVDTTSLRFDPQAGTGDIEGNGTFPQAGQVHRGYQSM